MFSFKDNKDILKDFKDNKDTKDFKDPIFHFLRINILKKSFVIKKWKIGSLKSLMSLLSLKSFKMSLLSLKLLLVVAALPSCNLAPKYHRPLVNMPEDYRLHLSDEPEPIPDEITCKAANIEWWQQLQDPALNNLITNALANNNDLGIAVARVNEYWALLGVVSSALFPQVGVDAYKDRIQYSQNIFQQLPPNFQRFNTYSALIQLSYQFDIFGKLKNRSDAAYADYLRQVEVRRTVVLTVVSEVAAAYITLLKFDRQLNVSKNTLKSRVEAERIARLRFQEGLTSELPLKQAESETGSAVIAIKILEIQIAEQENFISVLVGRPPARVERGKTLNHLVMPSEVPVGLPSQLLQQRPDILAAEDLLIATNYDIGAARAEFFPDLSFSGFYGNQSSLLHNLFEGKSVTFDTFFHLFQPIFTGGRLILQLKVAKARNQEALFNYYNTVLNALKEVNDALIAHKLNLELVVEQKEQVVIFRQYRHLAELQYNNGESDYLNVLDAERRLFESQLLLADREADSFISLINLYRALGGGWVIDADNFNQMVAK